LKYDVNTGAPEIPEGFWNLKTSFPA